MSLLTRQQILEADDLRTVDVDVSDYWPEPGVVRVSELTADSRDEFEQYLAAVNRRVTNGEQQYRYMRAPLVAMCLVDESGERVFSIDEVETLGRKNGQVLDRIFAEANKLNKIFGRFREDAAKNSEATPGEGQDGE
jgi:hypothetical protein